VSGTRTKFSEEKEASSQTRLSRGINAEDKKEDQLLGNLPGFKKKPKRGKGAGKGRVLSQRIVLGKGDSLSGLSRELNQQQKKCKKEEIWKKRGSDPRKTGKIVLQIHNHQKSREKKRYIFLNLSWDRQDSGLGLQEKNLWGEEVCGGATVKGCHFLRYFYVLK